MPNTHPQLRNIHPLFWVSVIVSLIITFLYINPKAPVLSIEEFSVPAFNKTSDHTNNNIYFDIKLINMNMAIGFYYDDPFTLSISYYPLEEPYQKYAWAYTVPAFYQGSGKTKHIKAMGNNNQLDPSTLMAVDNEEHETNHVGSLLQDQELEETHRDLVVEAVKFRVEVTINYKLPLWIDSHELELGGEVMVDANTGKRVATGSIKLVESDAVAGGPVMVVVLFASFLLIMWF